MQNPLMWLVNALNSIRTNVWSIFLIAAGTLLTIKGHPTEGGSMVTGGFAILKSSPEKPDPNSQTVSLTVPDVKKLEE